MCVILFALFMRVYSTFRCFVFFFFNDTATTEIYTLSYTTLFRSPPLDQRKWGVPVAADAQDEALWTVDHGVGEVGGVRSEEHTSELQSQSNLVCRLLLEKKKKTKNDKQS